jgi:hypothetical protein
MAVTNILNILHTADGCISSVLFIGFEVLAAVVMNSSIFWVMTPFIPLRVNRRLGGTCLNLQGLRVSQARNQHETGSTHAG